MTPEPAPEEGTEAQPADGAEPGAEAAAAEPAQPAAPAGTSLGDSITDEMLGGVVRPNAENWLAQPKAGVVTADYMLALHWGPGMNWYECGALMHDDKVETVAEQVGWRLVRTANGKYGWAVSNFVKDEG